MENTLEPTIEEFHQASAFVGLVGGFAGIGTAVVGVTFWIFRKGYRAGATAERARQQEKLLETINKNTKRK